MNMTVNPNLTADFTDIKLPIKYHAATHAERITAREQYVKEQKGLCYWCNQPLTGDPSKEVMDKKLDMSLFPNGFLDYPVHLQHCHKTGLTEGAVHCYCNGVMWQYHDR